MKTQSQREYGYLWERIGMNFCLRFGELCWHENELVMCNVLANAMTIRKPTDCLDLPFSRMKKTLFLNQLEFEDGEIGICAADKLFHSTPYAECFLQMIRELRRKTVGDEVEAQVAEMAKEIVKENRELELENKLLQMQVESLRKQVKKGSPRRDRKSYVYLMKDSRNGLYKIGRSNNPKVRERTLQSECPSVKLVFKREEGGRFLEDNLHRHFSEKRVRGEWFSLSEFDVKLIAKGTLWE